MSPRDALRSVGRRIAEAPPRAVLIAGWALFLVYAYPGYMSTDSVAQLLEVRTGTYSDAGAPVMAGLWSVIEQVLTGPIGLLLAQSLLLLLGAYYLFRRATSARAAAWAACGVLLFPPVMTTVAVIWRDSLMGCALVGAAGAIVAERRAARLGGLALAALAVSLRPSAALAVVPLVGLGFVWRAGRPWWERTLVAAAAVALAIGAGVGADRALTDEQTRPWVTELAPLDLAGVLRYAGPMSDAEVRRALAGVPLAVDHDLQARARLGYQSQSSWRLLHGDARLFEPPATDADKAALAAAWHRLVGGHRHAYLLHRWRLFRAQLGLVRSHTWWPAFASFTDSPEQTRYVSFAATHGDAQAVMVRATSWLARTAIFKPYVYFYLAVILLPVAIAWRQREAAALLAAGLLHELAVFFVAPTAEYRFSHWMVTATCLAVVLLVARRTRSAAAGPDLLASSV